MHVQAAREQKVRFAEALRKAESAHDAGELDAAKAAAEEALALEPNDPEAKALHSAITRDHAARERDRQVQGLVDEARKQISSRRYTSALEALKKAEEISPTAAVVLELSSLAQSGREQERRRKDLEGVIGEIQEALDRDDYVVACGKADEALVKFPDDRTLLKLKKLADNQRGAGETRKQVDAQIASARKLLDVGNAAGAQEVLRAALQRFPSDKGLQALLAIVSEAAAREDVERRKADYVQRAKDAIRRKAFTEAIHLL